LFVSKHQVSLSLMVRGALQRGNAAELEHAAPLAATLPLKSRNTKMLIISFFK
jgi:hypothetical protein